jgi:hypothetical protein
MLIDSISIRGLPKTMITGKKIAEKVFSDVEGFFLHKAKFVIKKEYDSPGLLYVSLKGAGLKSRIRLSSEFCSFEANTLDDLFFIIIIISHEIAHYLHKHNDHKDVEHIDVTAIETWADIYGAKIFMSVITFGKGCQALMHKVCDKIDQEVVLQAMGRAIGRVHGSIYLPNVDKRYPPAIERVRTLFAGITAFFDRINVSFSPRYRVSILITLSRSSGLSDEINEHDVDWDQVKRIADRSSEIHIMLQRNESAITPNLKLFYVPILVTNYKLTAKENNERREKLNELQKTMTGYLAGITDEKK